MPGRGVALGLAAGLLVLGCGGSDPEQALAEANRAVESSRAAVEKARGVVKQREAQVRDAQQKLADARASLREVEEELARHEAAVDRSATDTALFRAVQKQLLEDDKLSGVAISASVSNGAVVLTGSVPNGKLRDRAVEVAREIPGVTRVQSRIEVPVAARPPKD